MQQRFKYVMKIVTTTITLTGWLGIRIKIIDLKICRTVVDSYTTIVRIATTENVVLTATS